MNIKEKFVVYVVVKAEDQTISKMKYIKVLTLFWSCDEVVAEFYNT